MVLLAYISLAGCKSTSPVVRVVENNTHDTIVLHDTKHDSIFHTDSVYEYFFVKGDTVFHDKLKYVVKYKYSTKHDSIYIAKTDTIERPVYIEKQLTKWQALKLKFGGFLASISAVSLLLLLMVGLYILRNFLHRK